MIDHMLHGPAPKEGHLWVDEASPFPSEHCPVLWDARDAQDPEDRRPVRLRAIHFQIRDRGIAGSSNAALSATRQEGVSRPERLADLYKYFLASTIRAVERAHGPPREFGELPGSVDQVHRLLQAHAKRCPRWWQSLDTLKECLDLRQELAGACDVGNLQRYLSRLPEVAPFARPSRVAFPPPVRTSSHAPGPTTVLRSCGRGAAGQGQGGFGSSSSPTRKDAEGADAGGRPGPHRLDHTRTATRSPSSAAYSSAPVTRRRLVTSCNTGCYGRWTMTALPLYVRSSTDTCGGNAWGPFHAGTSTSSLRNLPMALGPTTARSATLSFCTRWWVWW